MQLPVEDDEVLKYLTDMKKKIEIHISSHGGQDEFLWVHLGVNGGLVDNQLQIERRCFNSKMFKDKNVPVRGPNCLLDDSKYLDAHYKTLLPINSMFRRLKKDHPFLKLSDNPGRYLCNYI